MSRGIENSIFLKQSRDFKKLYLTIKEKISSVYLKSFTHRLIKKINETIKICFRYSFCGRISEIKEAEPVFLSNSQVAQYLVNFYQKCINCLSASSAVSMMAKDAKKELYSSPVRLTSIIIITAILVNAFLSVILQREIDLWDFLIRVLFLFIATAGLSCEAGWSIVKKSSVFLRKMRVD